MNATQSIKAVLLIAACSLAVGCSGPGTWDKGEFTGMEKDGTVYVFPRGSGASQAWQRDGTVPPNAVTFSGPSAPNGQTFVFENERVLRDYLGEKRYNQWKSEQPKLREIPPLVSPGIAL
jgi:hypothetical protein